MAKFLNSRTASRSTITTNLENKIIYPLASDEAEGGEGGDTILIHDISTYEYKYTIIKTYTD